MQGWYDNRLIQQYGGYLWCSADKASSVALPLHFGLIKRDFWSQKMHSIKSRLILG